MNTTPQLLLGNPYRTLQRRRAILSDGGLALAISHWLLLRRILKV